MGVMVVVVIASGEESRRAAYGDLPAPRHVSRRGVDRGQRKTSRLVGRVQRHLSSGSIYITFPDVICYLLVFMYCCSVIYLVALCIFCCLCKLPSLDSLVERGTDFYFFIIVSLF